MQIRATRPDPNHSPQTTAESPHAADSGEAYWQDSRILVIALKQPTAGVYVEIALPHRQLLLEIRQRVRDNVQPRPLFASIDL